VVEAHSTVGPRFAIDVEDMPLPRISAAELMTENPRTVRVDDSIGEAVEVLQTVDFRHLPVVDEQGELVGMLSDRDLRALEVPFAQDAETVGTVLKKATIRVATMMSSNVVTAGPEADVTDLMELMLENKIGAVPVVDGEGELLGIVSYADVFRALLEEED
jgi:acetoin utilization protein AcuB